ncbi:MAG TPA: hypothetical protein VFA07_19615 [Chthonomonadaceae bacterium]|nr:hypothetical protein [Chthonomonadaceae bacterium]
MRTLTTMGLWIWLAVACGAQQAPAPQTAPPASQTPSKTDSSSAGQAGSQQSGDQAASGNQTGLPPAPGGGPVKDRPLHPFLLLDGGWSNWNLTGNERKFRQYATPPQDWFLKDLRYRPLITPQKEDLFVSLKDIGQTDYRGDARLALEYGRLYGRGFLSENKFFDPTTFVIDPSEWRGYGLLASQALTRDFSISLDYRDDEERLRFAPPGTAGGPAFPDLSQSNHYWDLLASGKLGGRGYAGLSFVDNRYSDHTGTFPDVSTQSVGLSYLWTPLDTVGVDAGVSRMWISEPDLPANRIDRSAISGDVEIGPDTNLQLAFQRQHLDLPEVRNAWVRDNQEGSFLLSHHLPGWNLQVGMRFRQAYRIRGDQSFVDTPHWTTLQGRLTGRIYSHLRLNVRGFYESLGNSPPSVLSDPQSLYWNLRDSVSARLDGNWPNVSGYVTYTHQHERNSGRQTEVSGDLYTVGGVWQMTPALSLFGEFAHESWYGRTLDTSFPTLGNFLPDSRIGVVELAWNLPRRLQVSFNYTDFATYNDNPLLLPDGNTHGEFFTLSGSYQFRHGESIGLVFSPWAYSDAVVGTMDYNTAVIMVTGSARF